MELIDLKINEISYFVKVFFIEETRGMSEMRVGGLSNFNPYLKKKSPPPRAELNKDHKS